MCAIAGIWGQGSLSVLERMTGSMAHRGPDGRGAWTDESAGIYLGHRRLSVIDLQGGAQPMTSPCGRYVITYNGEVYNHAELRRELEAQGCQFRTSHSDTEVLLHGYSVWGASLLDRLNGMWAFAIYDRVAATLFLARDRFGKKPLYYASRPEAFVFASELTALPLHPAVGSDRCDAGLKKFFAYGYVPAPLTALKGVRKLPAGCHLTLDCRSGALQTQRWWRYRIRPAEALRPADDRDLAEELRFRLERAVQRRFLSDVPVGIFLSGGLDSSAVAALSVQTMSQVQTFSIGFEEESFDESGYASRVAQHLGTQHHSRTLSAASVAAYADSVLSGLDEPLGDASLVATSMLCQFARERVTVALGGDGSDELLFGYDPFRALRFAQVYRNVIPRPVHEAVLFLAAKLPVSHRNMSLDFKLKRGLRGAGYAAPLWAPVWMSSLDQQDLRDFYGSSDSLEELFSEAIEAWEACESDRLEDRLSQFYVELYLQDDILAKIDRASMRYGLEVRAPFLDIGVVDFVSRLPARLKFDGGAGKLILRQAVRSLLPDEVLSRAKKGFGIPAGRWFRDGTLSPGPAAWGNPRAAQALHQRHLSGKADERAFLWNLLAANRWNESLQAPSRAALSR